MTTVVEIIASVVEIIGGLSLAFGGWSALSIGARSLFALTQFLSGFGMGFAVAYTSIVMGSRSVRRAALASALAPSSASSRPVGPLFLLLVTGAIIGPYLLLIDQEAKLNIFPADNKFARPGTNDMENHANSSMSSSRRSRGGWMLADVSLASSAPRRSPRCSSTASRARARPRAAAWTPRRPTRAPCRRSANVDSSAQLVMFLVWGGVFVVGILNQLSMRWGLLCYNRVGSHAALGPVEETLPELPTGATLAAQTTTERVRLVCENCFATVPTAQMPSGRDELADHGARALAADAASRLHLDNLAKDSIKDGRSIRFMDGGVQDPDGKMRGYNDSMSRPNNYYEPSFRSFANEHGIAGVVWLYFLFGFYPGSTLLPLTAPTLPCSALEASIKNRETSAVRPK
ncbi:hypothetical protein PINS_up006899 [Pythium insidiosum]|nr:hypothetical protein PINS_up006899 [Pythium insidiosum]